MKREILYFLIVGLMFFAGCTNQQPKYVCPDGEEVSSPDLCTRFVCPDGSIVYEAGACQGQQPSSTQQGTETAQTNLTQPPRVCSQPGPQPYCEGSTLYENFTCVDGTWTYQTRICELGCANASCIAPQCPVCNDNNSCTNDTCGPETRYLCRYTPLTNEGCDNGVRKCIPRARLLGANFDENNVWLAVLPYGASTERSESEIVSGRIWIGEFLDFSTALIRVDEIVLEGTCSNCGATPSLSGPPKVKITVINYLTGKNTTQISKKGDVVYFCGEGTCLREGESGCEEFDCTFSYKYHVKDILGEWTCS